MRIELFQDLYEHYSRLAISYPSDRPIAVKGLEARLIDTFNTSGGFGILEKYLHRCLLWRRADDTLKRIQSFRRGNQVPTWSWMRYDGPIQFIDVPYGQVSWSKSIVSPFTRTQSPEVQREHEGITTQTFELKAPVWQIAHLDLQSEWVILDEQDRTFADPLQCVVIGKSKMGHSDDQQTHYVLLVHSVAGTDDDPVYERVGVGVLERSQIVFEGPQRQFRIR